MEDDAQRKERLEGVDGVSWWSLIGSLCTEPIYDLIDCKQSRLPHFDKQELGGLSIHNGSTRVRKGKRDDEVQPFLTWPPQIQRVDPHDRSSQHGLGLQLVPRV